MNICNLCLLPKEAKMNCECPFKIEPKKVEISVITERNKTVIQGNFLTIEKWKKKALKTLKKRFNCNGFIKHGALILSGIHNGIEIKEILTNILQ